MCYNDKIDLIAEVLYKKAPKTRNTEVCKSSETAIISGAFQPMGLKLEVRQPKSCSHTNYQPNRPSISEEMADNFCHFVLFMKAGISPELLDRFDWKLVWDQGVGMGWCTSNFSHTGWNTPGDHGCFTWRALFQLTCKHQWLANNPKQMINKL